ncbi:hypothetical protein HUT19_37635 [Streptomyces sp. NA02950]|uniref:hypothetical protein n=1 Tax=Streptomyces sp. NA02950 TaxID=2742137 RepID=UPI001591D8A8|nr:hypothetical protein [Streptomyces sp. NA02950]QKV96717.1 hypothetical protein HUT19_37635 [Streptomyces sp. NA02950]
MSSKPNAKTYAERAAAEETQLHRDFADWIEEKTGQKVDLKSVQLACIFRMEFQRSEENQTALADKRAAAEAAKKQRAAEKRARLEAQLKKLQAELSDETAEDMPAETPAPAARTRKATPSKAATSEPAEPAKASEAPAPTKPRAARTRRTTAAKKTA